MVHNCLPQQLFVIGGCLPPNPQGAEGKGNVPICDLKS